MTPARRDIEVPFAGFVVSLVVKDPIPVVLRRNPSSLQKKEAEPEPEKKS
jgi:hypothetical protein